MPLRRCSGYRCHSGSLIPTAGRAPRPPVAAVVTAAAPMEADGAVDWRALREELRAALEADGRHERENSAKLRAVRQRVGSYREFRWARRPRSPAVNRRSAAGPSLRRSSCSAAAAVPPRGGRLVCPCWMSRGSSPVAAAPPSLGTSAVWAGRRLLEGRQCGTLPMSPTPSPHTRRKLCRWVQELTAP